MDCEVAVGCWAGGEDVGLDLIAMWWWLKNGVELLGQAANVTGRTWKGWVCVCLKG